MSKSVIAATLVADYRGVKLTRDVLRNAILHAVDMAREGFVHDPVVVLTSEGVDEGPGVRVIDLAAVYEANGLGYDADDIDSMAADLRISGFAESADALTQWWEEREPPVGPGYILQQSAQDPMEQTPWPVVFTRDGEVVHGRPDAARLLGFCLPDGAGERLDFSLDAVFEDNVPVLGLYPVFAGQDGGFFSISVPVVSLQPYVGDLDPLRQATAELARTLYAPTSPGAALAMIDMALAEAIGDVDGR